MDSDQEDFDPEISLGSLNTTSDFTSNLAGVIASNMIQAAIAGAMQPRPPQGPRRERAPRAGAAPRGYRKQSSSELDTDLDFDGEDFEMLDQSELTSWILLEGGRGAKTEPRDPVSCPTCWGSHSEPISQKLPPFVCSSCPLHLDPSRSLQCWSECLLRCFQFI